MKRHELRQRTMEYIYQHLVLDKPILLIIEDEGQDILDEEDNFIIKNLLHIEMHEDEFIAKINARLNDWQFERLAYLEQAILLVAISELDIKEDEKAIIIDEAIQLAKTYADEEAYKYINAVLDNDE